MKRFFSLALFLVVSTSAYGQNPATQRQALDKLSFLEGDWTGEAWATLQDGSRIEMTQTEQVRRKVDGLALLIEGAGRNKGSDEVSYQALATIFQDFQSGAYRMFGGTSDGRNGEMEVEVGDKRVVWWPKGMQNNVRYTITISDSGQWVEVGEFSPDGQSWIQFFGMTLSKVN
ncbi:MAG TPA: hypothetical protein VF190_00330 [Rhodothermales bacterium]